MAQRTRHPRELLCAGSYADYHTDPEWIHGGQLEKTKPQGVYAIRLCPLLKQSSLAITAHDYDCWLLQESLSYPSAEAEEELYLFTKDTQ